jgi:hypothetical protein
MLAGRIRSPRLPALVSVLALAAAALLAAPATAQVVLFEDAFEIGSPGRWSSTQPPSIPSCNCYFSGDCTGGFCDYGSLPVEDTCTFAIPKPQGVPGAGCYEDHPGPFQLGICDGHCTSSASGSSLGGLDPAVLAEGVELWSEAVLRPAERGGGPVDPVLAAAALALPIGEEQSIILGRQVASLMSEASDIGFYDYFCHFEAGDPSSEWFVDLAGDPCRLNAGRLAARALAAELTLPGSGSGHVAEIPLHCAGRKLRFSAACAGGPDAVACLDGRVRDLARFLTTPRPGAPVSLAFSLPLPLATPAAGR